MAVPTPADTRRFNRTAWITLALSLGLILFSVAQKAYRLTLPTDGWAFTTGEIGSADQDRPTYNHNLLGTSSLLQPGDRLLGVVDQPFEVIYTQARSGQIQPWPNWRAGETVRYTVERAGQPVEVDVLLYTWPSGTVFRETLTNLSLWASLLLASVGWFVFFKRPREWAARALLLFSICLLVNSISTVVVDWSLPEMLTPGILPIAVFCSNWIFAVVMFPSLLLLTLVFPQPKQFVAQYPRPVLILLYGLVPGLIFSFGSIAAIGWVSVLGMALLSLAALVHSFLTIYDPVGRAQMKWALGGVGLLVLGFIPINLSGLGWLPVPFPLWLEDIWFPLMLVAMALGFGVAILRYRLFDIDLVINRALVYGTLTLGVIGLYIFVVGYLSALFRVEGHLFISLVATGLVAVLFHPAREWLQRSVNRLMYGQRDEPVAVLSRLGERLETAVAPDDLLTSLVETVAQALKLPYVAIALEEKGEFVIKAATGQPVSHTQQLPLIYRAEPIGQLVVALRSPGEAFNPADRLLLENIAHQAGVAAHTVRLTADLQQSRQQLVTAREEERRRLRRDLHDDLGPQLASQTLTIDAIARLLERDPATARELLQNLKVQAQSAVKDIRRLVYNLRPPALDDLGLVAALREGGKQYEQAGLLVTINIAPDPLPALPAAVEVAAYRIVQEALTNVARHAQAKCCVIHINLLQQPNSLEVTITDNGVGLPARRKNGVGLNSMRERAEELGGRCEITPVDGGGTQVRAILPCEA